MAISYTPPSTSNLIGNPSEGGSFSDPASTAELQSSVSSAASAKVSETAALASKNAAATSETNALASKNAAATSEANALTSKNAAAVSATASGVSKTAAELAETNAATSEANALTSKNASAVSATASATSATGASNAASAASLSQVSASSSAATATSDSNSANISAAAAVVSKNAAATSATASATSATASETSRVASVAAKDLAEDWATKTSGAVEGSNFSAKYYSTVGNVPIVAGAISNVNTVGSNISNVNSVGSNISNVNTVAGNNTNINTVAGNNSNITTAAGIASNITTVAGISANVTTVAGINQTHLSNVSGVTSNLAVVGTTDAVSDLNTLAAISSDITSLANSLQKTYVVTVASVGGANRYILDGVNYPSLQMFRGNSYIFDLSHSSNSGHPLRFKDGSGNSWTSGVTVTGTPGNSGAKVTFEVPTNAPNSMLYYCTVHGNGMGNTISVLDSNISLVAASIADINTVAGANSNITSVVGNASNINSVAGNSTNINAVAGNATNINSAVSNATNINTVAGANSNISTVASNITSVNNFFDVYRVASSAPSTSLNVGDLYFDTSTDILKVYGASGWQSAGSSVNGTAARFAYTLTANQTTISGNDQSSNSLLYDPGFLDVYLNGVKLHSNDFTASSGTSIVLATGATADDILEVVAFGTFTLSNGTFSGTSSMGTITVTGTVDGRDVAADGTKLDGIEASATADQTAAEIRTLVESATDSNVFTDADHTKLNAIEASATADQTDAEIRAAVEAASDSNVFTDADHTKLNAIEASATADQTKSDIEGLGIDLPAANLTGTVAAARLSTATTQAESDDSTKIATTAYVVDKITTLIGGAPTTLNDLSELATAINNDANYNSTLTTALATKMPKAGGAFTGNVTFGDSNKAIFGAGSDLQIYHDGSNSYVDDAGAGRLYLRGNDRVQIQKYTGEDMITAIADGAVKLYHNNANKLETTSSGVAITGNTIAKGYFASEATNSTNKWLAYTHTDNTFRLNYNGSGSDEVVIDPDGQQTITAPAGDGNPAVALTMSGGSDGFNWAHTDFQASLASNSNLINMFGISGTARNAGYIGFKRIGALGATTNILTLGLHSADNVLNINGNSHVGIGTTAPSARLDVVTNDNVYVGEFHQQNTSNGDGVLVQVGSTAGADYALTVRSNAGNTPVISAKADGRVGIGTFTPSSFHNGANQLVISGSGGTGLTIDATSTTNSSIFFADGPTGTEAYRGYIQYQHGGSLPDSFTIGTSATDRMRIKGDGQIAMGNATTTHGNLTLHNSANYSDGLYGRNSNGAAFDLVTLGPSYNSHGATANQVWFYSGQDINIGGATSNTNSVRILGGGAERMRISPAGHVTKPNHPSFQVRSPSSTSGGANYSGGTASPGNLIFSGVDCNNGSHYNNSNGKFTAPVTGFYYFSFSLLWDDSYDSTGYVVVRKNNSASLNYGYAYINDTGSTYAYGYLQVAGGAVVQLNANEFVNIYSSTAGWHIGSESNWAGFLLG